MSDPLHLGCQVRDGIDSSGDVLGQKVVQPGHIPRLRRCEDRDMPFGGFIQRPVGGRIQDLVAVVVHQTPAEDRRHQRQTCYGDLRYFDGHSRIRLDAA